VKKILSMLLICCLFVGGVTLTVGCGDDKDKGKAKDTVKDTVKETAKENVKETVKEKKDK